MFSFKFKKYLTKSFNFTIFLVSLTSCTSFLNNRQLSSTDETINLNSSSQLETNNFKCSEPVYYKNQSVKSCVIKADNGVSKTVDLLSLKGSAYDMQFGHGYLLAEKINDGSLIEMLDNMNSLINGNKKLSWLAKSVVDCYVGRISQSVTPEFLESIQGLSDGYIAGMKAKGLKPQFSHNDFKQAILGIDLGNILGGLAHVAQTKKIKAGLEVLGTCGIKITEAAFKQLFHRYHEDQPTDKHKMGCIGFAASGSGTKDGKLIHGRNLDQTPLLKSWAKHPNIIMMQFNDGYKLTGTGTAGLTFPAGISGMNEHGLSVTLHQMNTTQYDSKHKGHSAQMVPELQQNVMRYAKNIDEAFKLIQNTQVFSAWTIFITDAKNNEIASIEISPDKKVIARRKTNSYMGQSNHFISPIMQDQHFHDSQNNVLETESRLRISERNLYNSFGQIDLNWMIQNLNNHEDYFEGETSFGRTPVKVSNIMSSVSIPEDGLYFMTVGDRYPASHSHYLGIKSDWAKNELIPIGTIRSARYKNKPNYEKSFEVYVQSYIKYNDHDIKGAILDLENAILLAKKDGYDDFTYNYNLARLKQINGDHDGAFKTMFALWQNKSKRHNYQQALLSMHMARISQDVKNKSLSLKGTTAFAEYEFAKNIFSAYLADATEDHATVNLKSKIEMINAWSEGKTSKIPSLSFSVID